ncbi:hypothetical protein UlMin_041021 [Ulmus minor]
MEKNLALQIEKYPRDLIQRLVCSSNTQQSKQEAIEEEDSDELELNLGLSLGGRFGVDKNSKTKLLRSSSIVGTMPLVRDDEATALTPISYPNLIRTSSLPAETEEEWRKRKELQTLRRMEAKRRRSEKQRNSVKVDKEGCSVEEERRDFDGLLGISLRDKRLSASPPFGVLAGAAAARKALLGGGVDLMAKGKSGFMKFGQPTSQGSVESHGGSSSGMSELESKPLQGSSSCGDLRSLASHQSFEERIQDIAGASGAKTTGNLSRTSGSKIEDPSKNPNSSENKGGEKGTNSMEEMPCVFTKGDGPNGRRVDGILYRYGKGEEVRIMCVCHGKFLSPAEFVKHAGGVDVANPLKHIVVNTSSSSLL